MGNFFLSKLEPKPNVHIYVCQKQTYRQLGLCVFSVAVANRRGKHEYVRCQQAGSIMLSQAVLYACTWYILSSVRRWCAFAADISAFVFVLMLMLVYEMYNYYIVLTKKLYLVTKMIRQPFIFLISSTWEIFSIEEVWMIVIWQEHHSTLFRQMLR